MLATTVSTMPDPANLPLEIFGKILDEIVAPPATKCPGLPTRNKYRIDTQQLYSSTLVSRRWHACSVSKFYSDWFYDGSTHTLARLWKFYRTVRSNRGIAMLVRGAHIEQWEHEELQDLFDFSEDANIMHDRLFSSDRLALWDMMPLRVEPFGCSLLRHLRALLALIMTYLPNLTKLTVIADHLDPSFASVLLNSSRAGGHFHPRRVAFQKLKHGNFHTRPRKLRYGYPVEDHTNRPLLENVWPAYSLPGIENLTIFGFEPGTSSLDHPIVCTRTSPVKYLTLARDTSSNMSYDLVRKTLTPPTTLAKLCLYVNDSIDLDPKAVTNAELWKILVTFQHSLQHLNVYRDSLASGLHNEGNEHMGLLSGFERLETLSIQPEALIGGCCGAERAPFQLKDTLPPSLRILTLYDTEEANGVYAALPSQLIQVVGDKRYAFLRSIALEDESRSWWESESICHAKKVEQACKEAKVGLHIYQGDTSHDERIACFPNMPGLERAIFYHEESDFSKYRMGGKLRQILDLGYRSSE